MTRQEPYSDLELFHRITSGDEQAFTEIYLRYIPMLLPHVSQLLDSDAWAEEIVQDVFARLWEIRSSLSAVSYPRAYIYRIASNRTMDYLRHRSAEVKMQYWLAQNSRGVSDPGIEVEFDFHTSRQLLEEAVSQLTDKKKLIYLMKHEEGYSYEEIAIRLKLSKNTVRNHLTDAIQFIRRYLLSHGVLHAVWLALYLSL